ncbi:hypothetical protein WBP07_18175 [Novosphingobium sp. BL-8A]|uniref:hypothetical protein n=1 Tax=Novosphingobium sp. BL-8A TaxID=3127639 RepID=UPI0037575957
MKTFTVEVTQDEKDMGRGIVRKIDREYWNGIPVAAYHWMIQEPDHPIEGLRERDAIAYHWSTGPAEAERLVRLSDVETLLAERHTDDLTAASQLEHSGLITREKYNHICENIRARECIRGAMA